MSSLVCMRCTSRLSIIIEISISTSIFFDFSLFFPPLTFSCLRSPVKFISRLIRILTSLFSSGEVWVTRSPNPYVSTGIFLSHQPVNIILVGHRNLGSKFFPLAVSQGYSIIFYRCRVILLYLCKLLFFLYGSFTCFLFILKIQKQKTLSDFGLACVFSNISLAWNWVRLSGFRLEPDFNSVHF